MKTPNLQNSLSPLRENQFNYAKFCRVFLVDVDCAREYVTTVVEFVHS